MGREPQASCDENVIHLLLRHFHQLKQVSSSNSFLILCIVNIFIHFLPTSYWSRPPLHLFWCIHNFLLQVWLVSLLHLASAWARWERRPDSWLNSSISSMRLWWNLSSWSCGWYLSWISLNHFKTHFTVLEKIKYSYQCKFFTCSHAPSTNFNVFFWGFVWYADIVIRKEWDGWFS